MSLCQMDDNMPEAVNLYVRTSAVNHLSFQIDISLWCYEKNVLDNFALCICEWVSRFLRV